jgi:hypothetical protein
VHVEAAIDFPTEEIDFRRQHPVGAVCRNAA